MEGKSQRDGGEPPGVRSTWHDGLHAGVALGRVLVAVALDAHQGVVLGGEGPLHQRAAAQAAQEALAVPVAILVGQLLGSTEGRSASVS